MAHPGEPVRLRIGVIGLGYFGGRHARVYADHPAAELIAVADIDGARVAELASAHRRDRVRQLSRAARAARSSRR